MVEPAAMIPPVEIVEHDSPASLQFTQNAAGPFADEGLFAGLNSTDTGGACASAARSSSNNIAVSLSGTEVTFSAYENDPEVYVRTNNDLLERSDSGNINTWSTDLGDGDTLDLTVEDDVDCKQSIIQHSFTIPGKDLLRTCRKADCSQYKREGKWSEMATAWIASRLVRSRIFLLTVRSATASAQATSLTTGKAGRSDPAIPTGLSNFRSTDRLTLFNLAVDCIPKSPQSNLQSPSAIPLT